MGLFGFFGQSEADKRATEIRTGTVAPKRAERQRCWEARDGFFSCLDAHDIVDPVKEEKAVGRACAKENVKFEQDCAREWVTYFKKWRVQDIQKRARLEALQAQGATKMDVNSDFAARK
ncbi:cytochrome oxidase c subunit VIb-domain-containing protein [Lasiosphaeris hirsuta]|uniref:Cytochrome oxidase c subunit VIb-domain-containing protein n=1 Tax=Lasiosphaeris hirsuta TaxID=260670 RepID=A0AA40B0K7_9PEZI|nr:cytochrome oxidase c subunit VIb-domain-containing protein [Lasiosphaeris hirsuta]